MKKIICILFISIFFIFESYSPVLINDDHIYIQSVLEKAKIEQVYERIFNAITIVESNQNPFAYNPKENAVGIAQIRQIRIDDYNNRTGKSLTLKDAYNVDVSREIFLYYARLIGHDNPELIIRKWNGSGPMTYTYLKKVTYIYIQHNKT